MWKIEQGTVMDMYTRKDEIFFGDDIRAEKAIGKKVYAADSPSSLLSLANLGNPEWCETLTKIYEDVDFRPFSTYVEGPWFTGYNHYDVIIIKKEEEDSNE